MQVSDIPYKFAEPWAINATGTLVTDPIPITTGGTADASQSLGFPPATAIPSGAGGTPPAIWDFNGVLFYETSWSRWFQARGPIFFDSTFSTAVGGYPKGAVLASTASQVLFWISTAENNTTDPDGGSPANWESVYTSINLPGNPTTTTQVAGNASTRLATTAFVNPGNSLLVNPGYRRNADGTYEQWFSATAAAGSGLTTTTIPFPYPYPTDVIDLSICFIGSTPPGANDPGSISIDFFTTLDCKVTTNYTNAGTTLGVRIRALGY